MVLTGSRNSAQSVSASMDIPLDHIRQTPYGVDHEVMRPLPDVAASTRHDPLRRRLRGPKQGRAIPHRGMREAAARDRLPAALQGQEGAGHEGRAAARLEVRPQALRRVHPPADRSRNWCGSTTARRSSSRRRCTRASASRPPRRWRAAPPWSPRRPAPSRSSSTTAARACSYPPGDPDALAAAIKTLLLDPERCRTMGAAASEHIRTHFTWQRTARMTLDLYGEVLDRARGTAK